MQWYDYGMAAITTWLVDVSGSVSQIALRDILLFFFFVYESFCVSTSATDLYYGNINGCMFKISIM